MINFPSRAQFRPTAHSAGAVLSKMDERNAFRGYDLNYVNGKLECHLINHWPDKAFKVVTKQSVSLNEWHHVVICYDGTRQASGVQLFVDGNLQELDVPTNNRLVGPITTGKPFHIGKRNASIPFHGLIDDVQLYSIRLSAAEVEQLARGQALDRLGGILAVRPADRSEHQKEQLKQFYVDRIDVLSRRMREQLKQIPGRIEAINKGDPCDDGHAGNDCAPKDSPARPRPV